MKLNLSILSQKPAVSTPLSRPKQSSFQFSPAARSSLAPTSAVETVETRAALSDERGLHSYQVPSALRLVNALLRFGSALDASDTGVGKTYVAAASCRELNLAPLIVCPKSVIDPWTQVCKAMRVEPISVINYEALRGGKKKWLALVNPENKVGNRLRVHKQYKWCLPPNACIIFDEGHRCKGQTSQNAEMLIAAKKQGHKLLILSATAATNPLEMKALGYALGLHWLVNFWKWCQDHGAVSGDYGGLHFDREAEASQKIMFNIHKQIFPARGTRIRIKDLGSEFPESQISAVSYDMGEKSEAIKAAYDAMKDEMARIEAHTANYSSQVFAIMMAARMKAEMLKVPTFIELTRDALDEDMSVAMFLNFSQSIAAVLERIKDAALVVGGQKLPERDQAIADFQADRRRVIVCNIAAGGIGISLHDLNGRYPRFALISPNYSAIQLKQALGRVWRSGGKTKSIQRIVFAAKTIEEGAARAVNAKLRNLSLLNDGDLMTGIKL